MKLRLPLLKAERHEQKMVNLASSRRGLESTNSRQSWKPPDRASRRAAGSAALNTRKPGAPTTARMVVSVQIGPSGSVISAQTQSAPEAYPKLADCVDRVVRSLKFPRASQDTFVNLPFVFAAR